VYANLHLWPAVFWALVARAANAQVSITLGKVQLEAPLAVSQNCNRVEFDQRTRNGLTCKAVLNNAVNGKCGGCLRGAGSEENERGEIRAQRQAARKD
jgi:hypothetical protein